MQDNTEDRNTFMALTSVRQRRKSWNISNPFKQCQCVRKRRKSWNISNLFKQCQWYIDIFFFKKHQTTTKVKYIRISVNQRQLFFSVELKHQGRAKIIKYQDFFNTNTTISLVNERKEDMECLRTITSEAYTNKKNIYFFNFVSKFSISSKKNQIRVE